MAQQTALVTLAPDDSIDAIIAQVKKTGAAHVDLLMPESVTVLQSRKACDRLRETANRDGIELTLYTDDPKIVQAAQKCQLMAVELDASALVPAGSIASTQRAAVGVGTPATTQRAAVASPPPPSAAPPKRSADEDFLASLEEMAPAPPTSSALRGAETIAIKPPSFADRSPEDDWADALDSLSVATIGGESALRDHQKASGASDDTWDFDAFNDFSDVVSGEKAGGSASPSAPARPRIRPEDIELSSEDLNRQLPKNKRAKPEKAAGSNLNARWLMLAVGIGLLMFAVWYFFIRAKPAVIIIRPAAQATAVRDGVRLNFQAEPVNDPTSAAIQGRVVEVPISVSVEGRVLTPTAHPDQTASGSVSLINRNFQDYFVPAGTRLRTTNPAGEEVVFLTTQEVTVPAASQSINGTANGRFDGVPITASAPGERFNLPANTDVAWAIDDFPQAVIAINIEPIGGGTNILKKLPTENDIRDLLGQAVPQFKQAVPGGLQNALNEGEVLADVEFTPQIDALAQNSSLYDMQTQPTDDDGGFKLVLTAPFRGFAVPATFKQQIERALPNALKVADPTFDAETTTITSYTLSLGDDPNANLLLASIASAPKASGSIDSKTINDLIAAVRGLSSADARLILEDFQQRGLIGAIVALPESQKLPDQIEIQVQE